MAIGSRGAVQLAAVLAAVLFLAAPPAFAQGGQLPAATAETGEAVQAPALPDPLTRQAVREVLSGLSDDEARDLLLLELDRRVAEREAELAERARRSFGEVLGDWAVALGQSWATVFRVTPRIPAAAEQTLARFEAMRGDAPWWRTSVTLILSLLGGLAAALGVGWLTRGPAGRLDGRQPAGLGSRIGIISARFLLQGARLIAFVAAAYIVNAVANRGLPADSSVVRYVVRSLGWTWFAMMAARLVLSPTRPDVRLCAVDDRTARFLTWRITLIFGWSAFAVGLLTWLQEFGWPFGEVRLGFWFSAIFYGLVVLTIWQARAGIAHMVVGHGDGSPAWRRFARLWPMIAIVIVALQWLIVELFVATGNVQNLSMVAMNVSLVLVLALPLFELMIRALVIAIWPEDPDSESGLRAAHRETQAGLVRCGRIIAVALVALGLAGLWGLDLHDLASQGVGAQVAGALMEIFLLGVVAYGLWELLRILADRQVAIERVNMGVDPDSEEQFEGEGGQGGTRLGTLMPLIRRTGQAVVVALAVLAILGQIGVNITPLLAGAGIVGLAVGFGAQTLVKDIISGVFFLVDDAFRTGEYIDIGTVKGTVEKISIRSMQLRHHNGPLNTIPFGEIRHLTNYSRDWVMMKLPLRVTYDTDLEKLRKLIKKLGQDLLQDPELGPKFLQPLKSQGVIQMEDSAMIVRVKFMTRPGDQWGLRNKVFAHIRELFAREGIKFAHREVTVRIADHEPGRPLSEEEKQAATAAARSVIAQEEGQAAGPKDDR